MLSCYSLCVVLSSAHRPHRALHSFPTRRSSDLGAARRRDADRAALAGGVVAALRRAHDLAVARDRELHVGRLVEAERSEEHTSELQSPCNLVCRLLLEKKKKGVTCLCSD